MNGSIFIGVRELAANPLRTLLSTLGVVIGVGALVAILSMGDGVERLARRQIEQTTDFQTVVITPRTTRQLDGQQIPRDDYPVFSIDDVRDLETRIPEVLAATLAVSGPGLLRGEDSSTPRGASVQGIMANASRFRDFQVLRGRFLREDDIESRRPVVVVSSNAEEALGTSLGDSIRIGEGFFELVGVVSSGEQTRQLEVFVPLPSASMALAPRPRVPAPIMVLKARRVEDVPEIRARVEQWLAARWDDWEELAAVGTDQRRVSQVRQAMLVFKLLMGAIAGISLIVGGIGIMNVLLASVTERTREIGVRRATGARQRDILLQFLAESVTITGIGSALGLGLGIATAAGVAAIMRARTAAAVYPALTPVTVLVAVSAAIVVGIGFGLYPALRAARLSPVDAIRHE